MMVPETGLEPARLKAYAPKAYVSTNSTTRAYTDYSIVRTKKRDLSGLAFNFRYLSFTLS